MSLFFNRLMATASRDLGDVELVDEDGIIVARHTESNVASQGNTKTEALRNLAEALELHAEGVSDEIELEEPDTPWF